MYDLSALSVANQTEGNEGNEASSDVGTAGVEAFAVRRKAVGRASGDAAFGVLKLLAVPHPLVRNIAEGKPSPRRPWPAVSAFSFATEGAVTQTGSGPLGRHE